MLYYTLYAILYYTLYAILYYTLHAILQAQDLSSLTVICWTSNAEDVAARTFAQGVFDSIGGVLQATPNKPHTTPSPCFSEAATFPFPCASQFPEGACKKRLPPHSMQPAFLTLQGLGGSHPDSLPIAVAFKAGCDAFEREADNAPLPYKAAPPPPPFYRQTELLSPYKAAPPPPPFYRQTALLSPYNAAPP